MQRRALMTETEIITGDMFKIMPQIEDNSFDYIFTSPPTTARETTSTLFMMIR